MKYIDSPKNRKSENSLDHNNLNNVDLASGGIEYGHINDDSQTISGKKTFTSIPSVSSGEPVSSGDLTNKNYVDNSLDGKIDIDGKNGDIDYLPFNTDYVITGSEPVGSRFWDSTNGTTVVKTSANTLVQDGQEVRYYGKASGDILNGQVVQFAGNQGDHVLFKVADTTEIIANPKLLMGIATEDISNGSFGNVVEFGYISDVNTTGWSVNDLLYWDNSTGQLTNVMPDAPERCILIAEVVKEETATPAKNGKLLVRISWGMKVTELEDVDGTPLTANGQILVWDNDNSYFDPTVNINNYLTSEEVYNIFDVLSDPTGFDRLNIETTGDISFNDGTYTFTIAPQGGESDFRFWINGREFIKTESESLQISTDTGIHVIYYDEDNELKELVNPNVGQIELGIRTTAFVSILYWNNSDGEAIYVGDERHGSQMDGDTHAYLHFTTGLKYLNGLGLNTFSVDGTGITADAQFGVDTGAVADEDLYVSIDAVASTTGLPIYYITGTNEWHRHIESGFSCRTFDGTSATRLAYNQFTGGVWQLTQVTNNDFVLYHIFATTEKDNPMIAIMGQNDYANRTQARKGALTEVRSLILDNVLFPEIRPIATVIYQTNLGYANTVNAKIVSTDEGDTYVDWRNETISRVSISTTDHGSLSNLTADDHPQYSLVDGTRDYTGIVSYDDDKTFTDDKELVAKKYVDDEISSGINSAISSAISSGDNSYLKKSENLTDVFDRQTSLNNLTNVALTSGEFVLTKDTSTGDALWKEAQGGSSGGGGIVYATDLSVTVNLITVTLDPVFSSYDAGMTINILVANTNTGAVNINVNALGEKNVLRPTSSGVVEISSGCIVTNNLIQVIYDGTQFQVVSGLPAIWE